MDPPVKNFFASAFAESPVMAILRGLEPREAVNLAEHAWDLGVALVEVPIQVPEAVATLEAVVRAGERRERPVGAGTVVRADQLTTIVSCGARFAVSPGFDLDTALAANEYDLPLLPGVMTPSDVQAALGAGLDYQKVFPASVLGPAWLTAMAGPFPTARFVATGGVNGHNAADYLAAGAVAVGVGNAFNDPEQVAALIRLTDTRRSAT